MRLVVLYGPPASGKLTIGRLVADASGLPLFHNHLIVDAVASVFPFGSTPFVRLREQFWLETIRTGAAMDRSLIFTFAPEPTVSAEFLPQVEAAVADVGGEVIYIALDIDPAEQERRVSDAERAAFGKLRSIDLLRRLRPDLERSMAAMPAPALRIDTTRMPAAQAADGIVRLLRSVDRA